mmetsp:Transcript_16321/g.14633  ORF Transcript_16321/g.14633 Transcript_16321/m.14633 type:complete len:165 (-) Transcript_16321:105-599(-)
MGNKSSIVTNQGRIFRDDESLDIFERLQRICDIMNIPSDDHNLRILIGSSINITSRNPHILFQIAEWHKDQTQCIPFHFQILPSKNKTNNTTTDGEHQRREQQFVFKLSLTHKDIINNELFQTQFIEYINNETIYNLNCVTNAINSNGAISSFISYSYGKDRKR